MSVDLTKYEIEYPVVRPQQADKQADVLYDVAQQLHGRGVCAAALDAFIGMRNDSGIGSTLAIEVPPDMFVDPMAVIESLRRVA